MKIIITMAGEGSRFKKIGIKKSKYEIVARDKTLFEWSMLSLSDFFSEEFIFIVKKSDNSEEFIKEKCTSFDSVHFFTYNDVKSPNGGIP